ncbi:MAG TPA: hypothetical protein PLU49_01495 [Saprospiraceae bacterium]|nr:hypothetical protein [Saprospiraceae bacterium]
MRQIFYVIFFFFYLNGYSQDSLKNITVGIGGGLIQYPDGKIYGYTHNYHFDYVFSNHIGTKLSLDFGEGQNNEKYYFDFSKSTILGLGLVYIPFKRIQSLNINSSFTIHYNTRILGTKDEIVTNNFALSEFTSYKKFTFYGLNIGIQCPIVQLEHFLLAAKIDTWASWLKIDALSAKFLVCFNF